MKKLFISAIVVLGFTAVSFGQATLPGHANAKATITAAHSISLGTDLNFGIFSIVNPLAAGAVSVGYDGTATSSNSTTPAGATASTFVLTGGTTDSYTLTLPSTDIELKAGAGVDETEIMHINASSWTTESLTGNLVAGAKTFTVGAILSFDGSEKPGNYVGEYAVTVNW